MDWMLALAAIWILTQKTAPVAPPASVAPTDVSRDNVTPRLPADYTPPPGALVTDPDPAPAELPAYLPTPTTDPLTNSTPAPVTTNPLPGVTARPGLVDAAGRWNTFAPDGSNLDYILDLSVPVSGLLTEIIVRTTNVQGEWSTANAILFPVVVFQNEIQINHAYGNLNLNVTAGERLSLVIAGDNIRRSDPLFTAELIYANGNHFTI